MVGSFHFSNNETKRELKVQRFLKHIAILPRADLSPGDAIQVIAHVPLPFTVTSQEANITRCIFETTGQHTMGAGANSFRAAARFFVHSVSEYYASVWCSSAHPTPILLTFKSSMPHQLLLDACAPVQRITLPVLARNQHAELRPKLATFRQSR